MFPAPLPGNCWSPPVITSAFTGCRGYSSNFMKPTRRDAAPLKAEKIWADPLDIVVSPNHPLAREKRVKLAELLEYPAILPGPGTYTREIILNAFGPMRDRIQVGR